MSCIGNPIIPGVNFDGFTLLMYFGAIIIGITLGVGITFEFLWLFKLKGWGRLAMFEKDNYDPITGKRVKN